MQRFDGGVYWGRDPKYGIEYSDLQMLGKLNQTGTNRALLTHSEAIFFDMYSGNEKTLQIAKKHKEMFVPMAVINPLNFDTSSFDYLQKIHSDGFGGVSFFAHYQCWGIRNYTFEKILKMINKMGLPVQISIASIEELSEVARLTLSFDVPVLIRCIRGGGYMNLADIISISLDNQNFYFDVGNLVSVGSIKYLADKIGIERLYSASNSPFVYEACSHLLVDTADLSDIDKDKIRFENLVKIFGGSVMKDLNKIDYKYDIDINWPKIDTHWHSEGWDMIEPSKNIVGLQNQIDKCSYRAVITSSILALNYDIVEGNKNTQLITKKDSRIFGYVVVDPMRVDESISELEKYKDNQSFVGIKTIQDYYGKSGIGLDDIRYSRILQWAQKNNWPILCHINGVNKVAASYPDTQFVVAHCTRDRMSSLVTLKNVAIDISASYAHRGETDLDFMIKEFGDDRILFAADGPLIAPVWSMGKVIEANLTPEQKEKIYNINALNIFKRLSNKLESSEYIIQKDNEWFLESDNIKLCRLTKKFISEKYLAWLNDKDVQKYTRRRDKTSTYKDMCDFVEYAEGCVDLHMAIIEKKSGKHIGNISLNSIDLKNKNAEVSIMIGDKSVWGHGYAKESINLLTSFVSKKYDFLKLWTESPNPAFNKLMKNLNWTLDQVKPSSFLTDKGLVDMKCWSKLCGKNIN